MTAPLRLRWLWIAIGAAGLAGAALAAPGMLAPNGEPFPHPKHEKLFPLCTTCHLGMVEAGAPVWPLPASCESCHDGVVEDRVEWAPRPGARATNLQYDHLTHASKAAAKNPADSALGGQCATCHAEAGAHRMTVQHAVSTECISCHRPSESHFAVADSACGTCHLPLTQATLLTRADVAGFPVPPSHERDDFVLAGHADLAAIPMPGGGTGVAASCATCHARDFCITCHVNAPEVAAIQALGPDSRSLAHEAALPTPPSHARADFLRRHGGEATRNTGSCAACHTQQSCTTCHVGRQSGIVTRLASGGPGRGPGAATARRMPETHTARFVDRHGPDANARPATCEGCHVRPDCLDCHRPGPGTSGYHPDGFLVRHPVSAYNRDATCSDCHNPAQFCQSCHQQSGLTAIRRIGARGYHDASRGFGLGHGPAARQNLESCASCHAERDCTVCHSAVGGGFRFSPHGPGFDPVRMRRKNASVCVACHGTAIPGIGP